MEWNNIIKNDYDDKTITLCECKCDQEVINTEVNWIKREYYEITYTLVCLDCEMSWTEMLYCESKGRTITIISTGNEGDGVQ